MRLFWISALALAVLTALPVVSQPADANGARRSGERWAYPGAPKRWGYYPHYRHDGSRHWDADPYAYHYAPRGYYPYYNSGLWRSAKEMRSRPKPYYDLPPYYQAWGYQDYRYSHRAWHNRKYGGHWLGHW